MNQNNIKITQNGGNRINTVAGLLKWAAIIVWGGGAFIGFYIGDSVGELKAGFFSEGEFDMGSALAVWLIGFVLGTVPFALSEIICLLQESVTKYFALDGMANASMMFGDNVGEKTPAVNNGPVSAAEAVALSKGYANSDEAWKDSKKMDYKADETSMETDDFVQAGSIPEPVYEPVKNEVQESATVVEENEIPIEAESLFEETVIPFESGSIVEKNEIPSEPVIEDDQTLMMNNSDTLPETRDLFETRSFEEEELTGNLTDILDETSVNVYESSYIPPVKSEPKIMPNSVFCTKCGRQVNNPEEAFCIICGNPIFRG